ncbi:hypothetical protein BO85DRAFT_385174 [Aspergillus piperis CBS 112811]|uniref:Uncharacterized protein n=1 Tax=Aspergillus piperis CBS 112811 TaxID=1448313 RepID=A0A8G1VG73_9EURO|nr:hypothetical protein BO85DRAFT_385174 [Aspergillus piperis CBS 112811]RAH51936.1 hypothetical protein BO85DRAFT_385174 [Aspergillus piperis CBS 112811]
MPETDTWLGIYNEEDGHYKADRGKPAGMETSTVCYITRCIKMMQRDLLSLIATRRSGASKAAGIASHDSVGLGKSGKTLAYTRKGMMYSAVRA